MPYPYSHLPATRAADYQSLMDYTSPQAPPMFSQGQGIPSYTPQTQAPVATGMDWGMSAPKFAFDGASMAGNVPIAAAPGFMDSIGSMFKDSGFLGSTDTKTGLKTDGWGGTAIGLANGLMSGYMGMKQYGLSKDILANNKAQFAQNFAAQRGTTNAALADRQARRVREATANGNPSSATSVADYMKQYGVA